MKCSSVIPCLSTGLAKNDKVMSMFVLFFRVFLAVLKVWVFFKVGDKPYTNTVEHDILVNF